MLTAMWVLNGLLAVLFAIAGTFKIIRTKAQLRAGGQKWTDDFSAGAVKLIGLAEVLGAVGLIVPFATGIVPILTPISAAALGIHMGAATVIHSRRNEQILPTIVLALLASASAALGFMQVL